MSGAGVERTPLAKRVAAFAALYFIWGSTYLAIRVAVHVLPPFLLAGTRSVVAGAVLCAWAWRRGDAPPSARQWRAAWLAGALFFLVGHGTLFWAQQRVPSGPAALVESTIPIWMVLAAWVLPGGAAPTARVSAGVALGLLGVALLPMDASGPGAIDPLGVAALLAGAMGWVAASFYFRAPRRPASSLFAAGMPLLTGGALLFLASAAAGEPGRVRAEDVTPAAVGALLYLIVFGSIVAFTAYTWLVTVETPARAGSYAYVNPLVALALGWALAGEEVTPRIALAAAVIVGSVALVVTGDRRRSKTEIESTSPKRALSRPAFRPTRPAPVHRLSHGGEG